MRPQPWAAPTAVSAAAASREASILCARAALLTIVPASACDERPMIVASITHPVTSRFVVFMSMMSSNVCRNLY